MAEWTEERGGRGTVYSSFLMNVLCFFFFLNRVSLWFVHFLCWLGWLGLVGFVGLVGLACLSWVGLVGWLVGVLWLCLQQYWLIGVGTQRGLFSLCYWLVFALFFLVYRLCLFVSVEFLMLWGLVWGTPFVLFVGCFWGCNILCFLFVGTFRYPRSTTKKTLPQNTVYITYIT